MNVPYDHAHRYPEAASTPSAHASHWRRDRSFRLFSLSLSLSAFVSGTSGLLAIELFASLFNPAGSLPTRLLALRPHRSLAFSAVCTRSQPGTLPTSSLPAIAVADRCSCLSTAACVRGSVWPVVLSSAGRRRRVFKTLYLR
jgi:hypothetical protein